MSIEFPTKHIPETYGLVFDFLSKIPVGSGLSSATAICTLVSGTDPSPSSLISGAVTVLDTIATVPLAAAGVAGCIYQITVDAISGGNHYILEGTLAVIA